MNQIIILCISILFRYFFFTERACLVVGNPPLQANHVKNVLMAAF